MATYDCGVFVPELETAPEDMDGFLEAVTESAWEQGHDSLEGMYQDGEPQTLDKVDDNLTLYGFFITTPRADVTDYLEVYEPLKEALAERGYTKGILIPVKVR